MRAIVLAAAIFFAAVEVQAHPGDPIPIVAAENFYGNVAEQIGGPYVKVTSILANPDQDPHLFEASPLVGRAVSAARIVIYNGIGYDPWMLRLIGAVRASKRQTIVVAALMGKKSGDNPHIWYDPATMLKLARVLSDALAGEDPVHKAAYAQRLNQFETSLNPVTAKIASLRQRYKGIPVTGTEPIFGYMFGALGMTIRDQSFQLSVMNNTEPAPSDIASFENDLKNHKVRLMIYNSQVADPVAMRMENLARESHIAIVGATETEPAGLNYQQWMLSELDAVDHALSGNAR